CGATRAQRKSPERLRVRGPLGKQRSAGLPASAAATAAAAWAAPAALAFLCFVHAQRTSPHLLAVQRLDGALRVGARHLNETEAARPAGLAIVDQGNGFHRAVLLEQLTHLGLIRRKRQVAHIDLCHGDTVSLLKKAPSATPS